MIKLIISIQLLMVNVVFAEPLINTMASKTSRHSAKEINESVDVPPWLKQYVSDFDSVLPASSNIVFKKDLVFEAGVTPTSWHLGTFGHAYSYGGSYYDLACEMEINPNSQRLYIEKGSSLKIKSTEYRLHFAFGIAADEIVLVKINFAHPEVKSMWCTIPDNFLGFGHKAITVESFLSGSAEFMTGENFVLPKGHKIQSN